MAQLTEQQLLRYSRNIRLADVGPEGQRRLLDASVLVVGAGGLGSPLALYLAAAGIGRLGIVDGDAVDISNLQRQVIHFTADVARSKVDSAADKAEAVNPDIVVERYREMLTAANADDIIAAYDFVVDATDNFAAKYLVNDVCVRQGKPFSYGGVLRFGGQTFTHLPGTACLRCLYGDMPAEGFTPNSSAAGILGPVVGMLGTIQSAEVLKYFTGAGRLLTDRLLLFDAAAMTFSCMDFARSGSCLCGSV